MKKPRFEDFVVFTKDSVTQLKGDWYLKLDIGSVLLVRSNNVPLLKDHFIVVTGPPVVKEHGLRPQTLSISAPNCSAIIDSFEQQEGATILMLNPLAQQQFLYHHDITVTGDKVVYSNLLIVDELLDVFEHFRMTPTAIDKYNDIGRNVLATKILNFIDNKQPVKFSMLGYPFKSGNTRDKVLGSLPDAAEEKSFDNFSSFARAFKQVYEHGAHFSIISDGYIFSDVFGIADEVVTEYNYIVKDMAKRAPVQMYDGTDFYGKTTPYTMRENVIREYGITHENLTQRILTDLNVNELYRGMIIFMTEETATQEFVSHSQRDKHAKTLAREAMIRNESYSALIQHQFQDHIRLSMHNSTNDGTKYSIKLLEGKSRFSPWHSALAVNKDGTFQTMHKKDAIALGYEIVNINNKPYFLQEV